MARESQTFPGVTHPLTETPRAAQDSDMGTRTRLPPRSTPRRGRPGPRLCPPSQVAQPGKAHQSSASAAAGTEPQIPQDLQPLHPPTMPWLNTSLKSRQRWRRPGHPPAFSGIRWFYLMPGLNHLCGNCSSLFHLLSGKDGGDRCAPASTAATASLKASTPSPCRMGRACRLPEMPGKPAAGPGVKVIGQHGCTKPGVGKRLRFGGWHRVGCVGLLPRGLDPSSLAPEP